MGGGLLGYVAGEMFVTDVAIEPWINANAHWMHWAVPILGILFVVGVAKWLQRRPAQASEQDG